MSEDLDVNETVDTSIQSITRSKLKTPKMFKVVLFNDNYTTKDFVVEILKIIFNKPELEATKIMMDVHKSGQGICGIYTYDVATSKVNQVHRIARENGFPLRSGVEET